MGRNLTEVIRALSEERQKAILDRTQQLALEVQSLEQFQANQQQIGQSTTAQLGTPSHLTLETLRDYVDSLGGTLDIVITLPGQSPIALDVRNSEG